MFIDNETLVTSSGVIRNRSKPRVGIVNANSLYCELFDDCMINGIDLSYDEYRAEAIERLKTDNPDLDDDEIDQLYDDENDCVEFDSRTFLLGAWVKNDAGKYEIDKTGASGSYALEYNTSNGIVSVEWSELTQLCNNTSPCYTMANGDGPCGNLDSPGNAVLAYTLPKDMFYQD